MSPDDVELLRAVREWRPPTTLHPIATQAWRLYEAGGLTLSDETVQTLRGILNGYGSDLGQLGPALIGLVRFSILLTDRQRDPNGAARVVSLLREYAHLFEPLWERVGQALENAGAQADTTVSPGRTL